ncbi:aBC transporter ATP-binding protein/permease protein [Candidatus Colimorpha enterica]|uniref:ABC transporter ATP-binding protein/permease protein n=1 Tax=Candidatus Colimorpha enterica TaxID=3083063 RepID=R6TT28_9BACT|nr:aBC transporter ATP-binding protein/permease protein [Candidatus Colimorpha enterica]
MLKRFCTYYKPHLKIFTYYNPHLKIFPADMAAAFLLSVCTMIYPLITRQMLIDFIPNREVKLLVIWAAVLLGIYLVKYFLNYFVTYYGHVMGVDMQATMRRDVFSHLETLPLSYFDDNKTGTIMSRIINDLMDVSELAHHGPEDLFLSIVMLVGSFIVMGSIYMPLTLIIYSLLPFMVFFALKKQKKMKDAFAASKKEVGEVNATLENSISGIRVSKAYTNSQREKELFERGNSRFVGARSLAYKAMAEFYSGMNLGMDVLRVAMYVAGGLFVFYGKIDIADFTAFSLYISLFISPIERLVGFIEQYQNGMTGFRRFIEIMDCKPESDKPGASLLENVKGDVSFENVSFSYPDGKKVLDGLSFDIEAGKTLALVGPSGGGKTTICHLIPRFYEVCGGRITIDGHDTRDVTLESLRKNIGIVSQDVFLFDSTIYDNIAYGCPDATREQIERASELANISDYIASLPEGYDTLVGERGVRLSGGQKQRIAIARVFLKNPPILILDEATSALDNVTEMLIQKSLSELCRGRTTIVVAHRLTTVKNADEILVITDDGIAERGTHTGLLEYGGIYAGLWRGTAEEQ